MKKLLVCLFHIKNPFSQKKKVGINAMSKSHDSLKKKRFSHKNTSYFLCEMLNKNSFFT